MSQSQMDQLAHMLEESGADRQIRAAVRQGRGLSRRGLLLAGIGLSVFAGGGGLAARLSALNDPRNLSATVQHAQAEPLARGLAARDGDSGATGVVWSSEVQNDARPVFAPGGTGAVIDADGHVRIVGAAGEIAKAPDVTPEAALVAGQLGHADVVAWTTGRVMSWWTEEHGIQRVEHTRPLGITSVGGGILVFDDESWSGKLDGNQVTQVIAGNDSITIGVTPDGVVIAATADGIITRTESPADSLVVQPAAPEGDDIRVRRAVGVYKGHIIFVWDTPGAGDNPDRELPVTVMNLETGRTTGAARVKQSVGLEAKLRRSQHGAEFAGLIVGTDGPVSTLPADTIVIATAGDYFVAQQGEEISWLDGDADTYLPVTENVSYQLTSGSTQWQKTDNQISLLIVKEQ